MSSSEEPKPNQRRLCFGVGAAAVDGVLLAVWGLATRGLGVEQPTIRHYGVLLCIAGLGYFALSRIIPQFEQKPRFSRSAILIISAFSLISALQFSLGVLLFEFDSAKLNISALLRNSSLIFAVLLCHCAFLWPRIIPSRRIDRRAVLGIVLFSTACWFYVGLPVDGDSWYSAFSIWGALSIWIGFNRALTEILTHAMTKHTNRFSMNFGLAIWHLLLGGVCLLYGSILELHSFKELAQGLSLQGWISLLGVSLIIPLAQGFRFFSLSVLNDVVGKKGISIWVFLFCSMLFATILLGEPAGPLMLSGLVLAFIAVVLLEPGLYFSLVSGAKRLFRF